LHNLVRALVAVLLAGVLGACATTGSGDPARSAGSPPRTATAAASAPAMPQQDEGTFGSTPGREHVDGVAGLEVIEIRERGRMPLVDLTRPPDDLWQRIRNGFAIPDLDSPLVLQRQAAYAANPQALRNNFERARRYLHHIVEEVERRNMPTELALLPMVESSYNPMALSSARAAGLWQFIPSTGRQYNLQQNWWYDGRRDIVASTSAALDYLQKLYEMYGDWYLALASYNWGEGSVGRAIEKNKAAGLPTDYMSLQMPDETRNYVPKLQAIKNIVLDPTAFGLVLDPIENRPYFVTVTLTRDIDLDVAAQLAEMPLEELRRLNPAHNRPMIESSVAPTLVLPADRAERFARNLATTNKPLSNWSTYTARAGDRLPRVAAAYGLSADRLAALNGLPVKARLASGQTLLVPARGSRSDSEFVVVPASAVRPTSSTARDTSTSNRTAGRSAATSQKGPASQGNAGKAPAAAKAPAKGRATARSTAAEKPRPSSAAPPKSGVSSAAPAKSGASSAAPAKPGVSSAAPAKSGASTSAPGRKGAAVAPTGKPAAGKTASTPATSASREKMARR
jgi:membrane-bound lytic murein transglycosylase D